MQWTLRGKKFLCLHCCTRKFLKIKVVTSTEFILCCVQNWKRVNPKWPAAALFHLWIIQRRMTPGAIVWMFLKFLKGMTNTAASRSERRVIDPLVEMAQLFSKPPTHRSVTRTKNKFSCMYRVSYVSVSSNCFVFRIAMSNSLSLADKWLIGRRSWGC